MPITRDQSNRHYASHTNYRVRVLKVTTLADRELLAALDIHIPAQWKHHVKTAPQVVRILADDSLSVAAEKASHNCATKYELYTLGVKPLILQRGSKPLTLGHNALIRANGYSQRQVPRLHVLRRSARPEMPGEYWAGIGSSVELS